MTPLPQYPPPPVQLPIRMDIIHHPKEKKVKSTAVHAIALCPTQASMWEFPTIPSFDPSETLFLYPSKDAKRLTELDLTQYKRAVFVDSTWPQSKVICADPKLQSLTKVSIDTHKTLFWRCQDEPPEFLATIEAIYFFYKAFIEAQNGGIYNGEVDNLLWYYVFQYEYIQGLFTEDTKKEVSHKLDPNYFRGRKHIEDNTEKHEIESKEEKETEERGWLCRREIYFEITIMYYFTEKIVNKNQNKLETEKRIVYNEIKGKQIGLKDSRRRWKVWAINKWENERDTDMVGTQKLLYTADRNQKEGMVDWIELN